MSSEEFSSSYETVLKQYFGYDSFREHQREIIAQFLSGRDCFVMMATGSGKSICFQLPPLICGKTLFVISPLISLMQDQVIQLREMGVKTTFLGSAQTNSGVEEAKMRRGELQLVYLTPEKLGALIDGGVIRGMIEREMVCGFAIDEAHCLVEWGFDFRPSYRSLDIIRKNFPEMPIMALTATATAPMIRDIVNVLGMENAHVCTTSFDRTNLFYTAKPKSSYKKDLKAHFTGENRDACTIVFVNTQKLTSEIAEYLRSLGVKACAYHAGMDGEDRERAHRDFYEGRCSVICATIAYAMGISLYSVRRIINYGAPSSLECLVQQQGRAGRDGLEAECFLYYGGNDWFLMDHFAKQIENDEYRMVVKKRNRAVKEYCGTVACRRAYVLRYLGEEYGIDNCGKCDNCCRGPKEDPFKAIAAAVACVPEVSTETAVVPNKPAAVAPAKKVDLTEPARMICKVIAGTGSRYGAGMIIKVLRGSREKGLLAKGFQNLPEYGTGKGKPERWWKAIVDMLVRDGILGTKKYAECDGVSLVLADIGRLLADRLDYKMGGMVQSQEFIDARAEINGGGGGGGGSSEARETREAQAEVKKAISTHKSKMDMLIELRRKLAAQKKIAPFLVFQDATLNQLANSNGIRTITALAQIHGMNVTRLEAYGEQILACLLESETGSTGNTGSAGNTESTGNTENTESVASAIESKETDTENKSFNLLKEGYTVSDIAGIRGISEKSVEDHIALVIKRGERHFPRDYFMSDEEYGFIMDAKSRLGHSGKLRPLIEMVETLHPGISYFKVKVALAFSE